MKMEVQAKKQKKVDIEQEKNGIIFCTIFVPKKWTIYFCS